MASSSSSQSVSTHSRPKAAGDYTAGGRLGVTVSTHSRPKAAGRPKRCKFAAICRFNTQPPEGGWDSLQFVKALPAGFNTQPPEGGWRNSLSSLLRNAFVSTHSRPKAAGSQGNALGSSTTVSTHSRPKAAGTQIQRARIDRRSFNTQPPEGGWSLSQKPCSIRFRSPDFARLTRKARTRV